MVTFSKKDDFSKITSLTKKVFRGNLKAGWWENKEISESKKRKNGKYTKKTATLIASKIALCHSELSESLEGMRKGLMDDHLKHRPMIEVELADTVIRIFDLAGFLGLDLGGAIKEKLAYNKKRMDHKLKNRNSKGGKCCLMWLFLN